MNVNGEHKDRLFKKVFGPKEDVLSLYNAINGTNYNNPDDIVVNTIEDEPDERYMNLSESFTGSILGFPAIDCVARMLNINYGHNKDLMDKCQKLREYSLLIKIIRENIKSGLDKDTAIDRAIDECIHENILADLLAKNRMEVTNMLLAEYDEKLHIDNEKEISYDEGEKSHLIKQICKKIDKGLPIEKIAEEVEEDEGIVREIYNIALKYKPDYNTRLIYKELENMI